MPRDSGYKRAEERPCWSLAWLGGCLLMVGAGVRGASAAGGALVKGRGQVPRAVRHHAPGQSHHEPPLRPKLSIVTATLWEGAR